MSSEALERARYFHVPQDSLRPSSALEADPPWPSLDVVHRMDYDALLAEVARLEQERDEMKREPRDVRLYARIDEIMAALAVARDENQRLRQALEAIATRGEEPTTYTGGPLMMQQDLQFPGHPFTYEIARAALEDDPAAAIGRQAVDDYRHALASLAEAQTVASVGQPPAAATLAEPEYPTESVSEATGSDASHSQAQGDSGSASAAADEPGETPA